MKKGILFLLTVLLVLTGCVNVKIFGEKPLPTAVPAPEATPTVAPAPAVTAAPASTQAPAADGASSSYAFTFTADTLDGETVTEEFFGQYDLTMVNVWASWCPPCRAELPDLGELYTKLPENVGFLSVTMDDPGDLQDAKALLAENGCAFPCLDGMASGGLYTGFLHQVTAIPTTVFFDRNGNQVGNPVLGAPERNGSVVEGYMAEIQTRLAQVNGK